MEKDEILSMFFAMHYVDMSELNDIHYDNSVMLKRAQNFIHSFNELAKNLNEDSTSEEITFHSYEHAKTFYGKDNLRDWFSDMNLILFDKKDGARLPNFIMIYGVNNFIERVDHRINYYFSLFKL